MKDIINYSIISFIGIICLLMLPAVNNKQKIITSAQKDSIVWAVYEYKQDSLSQIGQSQYHKEVETEIEPKMSQKGCKNSNVEKQKYTVSKSGEQFIKNFEGCQLICYRISGENSNTVGWGHKIKTSDPKHLRRLSVGERISQIHADNLFKKDIDEVNFYVNYMLSTLPHNYEYSQGFIDGLGSLVYNCGMSGVMNSEFWNRLQNCRGHNKTINSSDLNFTLAAVKHMNITKKGHIIRRQAEYELMLS